MESTIKIALADAIIITLLTGIVGILLGAFINHLLTRNREKESSKQFQRRTVIAIRSELESIIEINTQGITSQLRNVADGDFLRTRMEITQDYFTVFNSNCSQMGRIDENLSGKLVRAYSLMKAMVDAYRIHNNLLTTYWEDPKWQNPKFVAYLAQQTVYLKEADKVTTKLIEETFALMDKLGFKK